MDKPDEKCGTDLMLWIGYAAGMLSEPANRIEVARFATECDLKIGYLIFLRNSLSEVIARAGGS